MSFIEDDLEGSLVLEKLAEINQVDAFLEAVDSDNFKVARALMKKAGLDTDSISQVLKMMSDSSD